MFHWRQIFSVHHTYNARRPASPYRVSYGYESPNYNATCISSGRRHMHIYGSPDSELLPHHRSETFHRTLGI